MTVLVLGCSDTDGVASHEVTPSVSHPPLTREDFVNTTADLAYLLLTQRAISTRPDLQAHLRTPFTADIHLTAAMYAERTGCVPLETPVFGVRPHLKFRSDVEEVIGHARVILDYAIAEGWQPPHPTTPF